MKDVLGEIQSLLLLGPGDADRDDEVDRDRLVDPRNDLVADGGHGEPGRACAPA